LYAGYIPSDLLYGRSQLLLTAPRDENIRAFVHKLFGRRKANTAIATGNESKFFLQAYRYISPCPVIGT
jgi:hypothetical protein